MRRGLGCWFLVLIYAISHHDFKKGLLDSLCFKFTWEGSNGGTTFRPGWSEDHLDLEKKIIYNNLKFFIYLPLKRN